MDEINAINEIINYEIKVVEESARFWLVRTNNGHFYKEFITNGYIALAWNIIDSSTSPLHSKNDYLKGIIKSAYPHIKRPATVINKCNSFINEIKNGDYILIPSTGSEEITFAIAGEYYEEQKTYELEKEVVSRTEMGTITINDADCPYKKRRKITPLITIKSSYLDGRFFKAISNQHGISRLDDYWRNILGELYNVYYFRGNLSIVYHVRRTAPISPRQLAKLLSSVLGCWSSLFEENQLSVKVNVSSPGSVDFLITDVIPALLQPANLLAGLTMFMAWFKPESIPSLIKNIFTLPAEIKREYFQLEKDKEEHELKITKDKLAIIKQLQDCGVNVQGLVEDVTSTFAPLQIEPIVHKIDKEEPTV